MSLEARKKSKFTMTKLCIRCPTETIGNIIGKKGGNLKNITNIIRESGDPHFRIFYANKDEAGQFIALGSEISCFRAKMLIGDAIEEYYHKFVWNKVNKDQEIIRWAQKEIKLSKK